MTHVLLLLCCFFGVTLSASLLDQSANQELARYMYRSKIIHQRLLAEGCADVAAAREKRSVLSVKGETQVKIEKQFYDELTDMLIKCRQAKQTKATTPTTPATSTSPTTTKPTTPTTTAPTTTPPTTTIPTTTTLAPQPDECQQAINLTEAWRVDHNGSELRANCDNRQMEAAGRPWFRFTGAAGNRLLDHCVPEYSCGTHIALWSDEVLPTSVGVATRFNVFGSYQGNCKFDTLQSSVMRCSVQPHDFIYRWEINSGKRFPCAYGFCGMNADI